MASPDRLICDRFPYIPLMLSMRGARWDFAAFVDTGFEGDIVVPDGFSPTAIRPSGRLRWRTAADRWLEVPSYFGLARIDPLATFRVVVTMLGDEFLIGRRATDQFLLTLDHGNRLIAQR